MKTPIIVEGSSLTSEVYRKCLIPFTLSIWSTFWFNRGHKAQKAVEEDMLSMAYWQAEHNSNCKTRNAWFIRKPLSNYLARLTGNISSRFLDVISQCLQEKLLVFFFPLWPLLFFGSANNSSLKGCTHLRPPSWAVTCWLGEQCTHFTLCSRPAHSINGKKTKNNQQQKQKTACQWKIWRASTSWFSGKMYQNSGWVYNTCNVSTKITKYQVVLKRLRYLYLIIFRLGGWSWTAATACQISKLSGADIYSATVLDELSVQCLPG